ncbi:PIN domain-containing protein [Candidatus Woesearchaeota archaeon]|nr:PIN domain-containing protein [Candidatus Woesearchaeota archaeon]
MSTTVSRYFLDSSILIDYFLGENTKIKEIVDSVHILFISIISLFELRRVMLREGIEVKKIEECIGHTEEKYIIIALNAKICKHAAELSVKERLAAMDSLIYATSLSQNAIFVTGDNDFRGKRDVMIIA